MEVDKAHRDALLLRMVEGSKAGTAPLEELNTVPEVVQTYVLLCILAVCISADLNFF